MLVGGDVIVVSTGLRSPARFACEASVRAQFEVPRHLYIESDPDVTAAENLYTALQLVSPHEIVIWIDGDDWLAHPGVTRKVLEMHTAGALVTYGQYMTIDGAPGHCAPYDWSKAVRHQPWYASHLRTFRAGLFQRLNPSDLQDADGCWLSRCVDLAVMFPLLEMAGADRVMFCPEVLCVYNSAASWERTATAADLDHERCVEMGIRQRPAFGRVEGP